MKTIVTISGIRPDFIRMSEVFKKLDANFNHILIHTGQHYDKLLSDVFFTDLDIRKPDYNLGIGAPGKKHYQQQASLGPKIIDLFKKENISPDIILFLGDSNSVLASVPLRKEGYKIGHIEAGMRSYDERMLEEINRKVCDHVSNLLFVYHENYKKKAMREGISEDKIFIVGNTIVEPLKKIDDGKKYTPEHILVDIHRPENFNFKHRMEQILLLCKNVKETYGIPVKFLKFKRVINAINNFKLNIDGIELVDLMGYKDFVTFQKKSLFIISDSGTAQEEPALLNIPVIVPRDFTERPESIENGNSFMYPLNKKSYKKMLLWLEDSYINNNKIDWLGNGTTSEKIIQHLYEYFEKEN